MSLLLNLYVFSWLVYQLTHSDQLALQDPSSVIIFLVIDYHTIYCLPPSLFEFVILFCFLSDFLSSSFSSALSIFPCGWWLFSSQSISILPAHSYWSACSSFSPSFIQLYFCWRCRSSLPKSCLYCPLPHSHTSINFCLVNI